jgi:hypothetical protein
MKNTILYILGLMCGVGIGGSATIFSTNIIIKVYSTKKIWRISRSYRSKSTRSKCKRQHYI